MERVYYAFKTVDGALFEDEAKARNHEYEHNISYLKKYLTTHPEDQRREVIRALRACAEHLANMPTAANPDDDIPF